MIAKEICIEITYLMTSLVRHLFTVTWTLINLHLTLLITSHLAPTLCSCVGWGRVGVGEGGDVLLLDNKVSGRHYARPTGFSQRLTAP